MELYKELLIAIENKNIARVRQILILKNYVNKQDEYGVSPLMWASVIDNTDILKLLLNEYNADTELRDKDGTTAIMCAAYANNFDAVKELVKHHANINAKQKNGFSALTWANLINSKQIENLLITEGADLRDRIAEDEESLFNAIVNAIECNDEKEVIITICSKYLNTIHFDVSNSIRFLQVMYIKLSAMVDLQIEKDKIQYRKFINNFKILVESYSINNREEILDLIRKIEFFL